MAQRHHTEGERWAQAELERLREARWTPVALGHLLTASQRRANDTRTERAPTARVAGAWMLVGAAAWAVWARCVDSGPVRSGLTWWAACALMLDWHLGMLETPDGRPVSLGAADALTLARAWLVPVVAADGAGASTALLAGALSDLADGAVARRTRTTRLGRDLEGLVDACFTTAALTGARRRGRLSRLPVALELGRLAAGTGYALGVYLGAGHAPDPTLSAAGRRAAPVRVAGLAAAGAGQRRLADGLLVVSTALGAALALDAGGRG